jgi:ectoine hydroxylase-related dioxygenase (phytanoyl-CoA dioxygenase family)
VAQPCGSAPFANVTTLPTDPPDAERDLVASLDRDGFAWRRSMWLHDASDGPCALGGETPERPVRDVLDPRATGDQAIARLRELACDQRLRALAASVLCCSVEDARAVRATFFTKSLATSWFVPWHRDRTVRVRERIDVAGFTGWTRKDGVDQAIAPDSVLRTMVALRVHLDDCSAEDGALEVVPGSHLRAAAAESGPRAEDRGVVLTASRGDVLVMRPLLLHRSAKIAQRAGADVRRRVLHVEFTATALPAPLAWFVEA